MWQIINVKSPYAGANLNDPNRYPIDNLCDERLNFLQKMATSLKLMDRSKKGKRIRALTSDTANALHVSLNGLVELTKTLLERGMKYVCIGKLQSDNLEGEFGVFRQLSGGNYLISVEQVTSSLSLRRIKLYHKLNLSEHVEPEKGNECCATNLEDRDEDLELLDDCFNERICLNLRLILHKWVYYIQGATQSERSSLYYISGYITFKEQLNLNVPAYIT